MKYYEMGARAAYEGLSDVAPGIWESDIEEWYRGYYDAKKRMVLDKLAKEFAN